MRFSAPLAALGEGDCEAVGAGLLAQPANALSSLVFAVAGLWLISRARRSPGRGWPLAIVGSAEVATGLTSLLYHGPMGPLAGVTHDLGVAALPLSIAAVGAAELAGAGAARAGLVLAPILGVATVLVAAWPAGAAVTAGSIAAAVVVEAACWLRGHRGARARRAAVTAGLVLAAGAVLYVLGRTGGPLCDPGSLLQPHAAWHALVGVAVAVYARAALGPRARPRV